MDDHRKRRLSSSKKKSNPRKIDKTRKEDPSKEEVKSTSKPDATDTSAIFSPRNEPEEEKINSRMLEKSSSKLDATAISAKFPEEKCSLRKEEQEEEKSSSKLDATDISAKFPEEKCSLRKEEQAEEKSSSKTDATHISATVAPRKDDSLKEEKINERKKEKSSSNPDAADTSATSSAGDSKQERNTLVSPRKEDPPRDEENSMIQPSEDPKKVAEEVLQPSQDLRLDEGGGALPLLDGLKPLRRESWLHDVSSGMAVPSAQRKKRSTAGRKTPDRFAVELQASRALMETQDADDQGSSSSSSQNSSGSSSGSSVNKWENPLIAKKTSVSELIKKLRQFLAKFIKDGDGSKPYYPSQVIAMNARESKLFSVDFNHVLSDKVYIDIALKVGNEESHEWMVPTVLQFMKFHGYEVPNVYILFSNKPASISSLKDFMSSQACWDKSVCCSDVVHAITEHGRIGFVAGVRAVIDRHIDKISYGGNFTIDDMLIMDSSRCWIYGKQLRSSSTNCRLDMSSTWSVYKQYFRVSGSISGTAYPLEFEDFIEELTRVSESRVTTPGYREMLYYYPTIAPPLARDDFVRKLLRVVWRIGKDEFINVFPSGPPGSWSTFMGADHEDWRDQFFSRDGSVFDLVFWHENDKKYPGGHNFKDGGNIVAPFDATVFGQLWCKRNLLEHAPENGATDTPDKIELYATSKFKHLMGYLFRKIMELDPIEREKKYGYVLRSYKKLFGSGQRR